MTEITSFNQLFWEASQNGLLLNSFLQLPNREFRANWRTADNRFFDCAQRQKPFDCLLEAYLIATGKPTGAAPAVAEDEWFT